MIRTDLTSKGRGVSSLASVLPRFSPGGRLQVLAAVFLLLGVLFALLPAWAQAYGRVKLEPAAGPAPSSTVLSGSGFPRSRPVVVSARGRELARVRANSDGRFRASVRVPVSPPGVLHLISQGGSIRVVNRFRVGSASNSRVAEVAASTGAHLRWSPTRVPGGASISLRGGGFAPRALLRLITGGSTQTFRATDRGTFSRSLRAPGGYSGLWKGGVQDSRVHLPFSVTVDLPAPSVPASGAYFGAYVNSDAAGGQTRPEISDFETMIGRKLRVGHHYRSWDSRFHLQEPEKADEGWDVANGRIPMISQSENGSTGILDAINSGAEDGRIIDRARRIRDFGHPLFYRLFWEMNGDWNSYNETRASTAGTHDGTEKYVRAWRRVHSLFRQEGATNAAFVWCPNASDKPKTSTNHWTNYYPGDGYVDWVCADGYNRGTDNTWSSWTSFADIFRGVYDDYPQKPFMVGETSSTENGGDKAQWIRDAHSYFKASMPRARAFLWFHRGLEPDSSDFRVDTSSSSLESYREMGSDPYFGP